MRLLAEVFLVVSCGVFVLGMIPAMVILMDAIPRQIERRRKA
jgi:hypothetical protein